LKKFKHKETGSVIEVDENSASAMERYGYIELKSKHKETEEKTEE
jgi:hypothetical protein